MSSKWFTFGYHNVSRWVDACRGCGRLFKLDNLNKDRLCRLCEAMNKARVYLGENNNGQEKGQ